MAPGTAVLLVTGASVVMVPARKHTHARTQQQCHQPSARPPAISHPCQHTRSSVTRASILGHQSSVIRASGQHTQLSTKLVSNFIYVISSVSMVSQQ